MNQLPYLEAAERSYLEDEGKFAPRFWLQGRLNFPPWSRSNETTSPSGEALPGSSQAREITKDQ